MDGKYDKTIGEICLDAIKREAYNEGFRDGARDGFVHGNVALCDAFEDACTVTKVVHNGKMTIVTFNDGGTERVTYDPSYGYAYDAEKGVMAAILKHLTGGRYIKALKEFERDGKALVFNDTSNPASVVTHRQLVALGQALVEGFSDAEHGVASDDSFDASSSFNDNSSERLVSLGRALIERFANYDADAESMPSPNSASFEQLVELGRALVGCASATDNDGEAVVDADFRDAFNDMDSDNVFDGT